MSQPIMPSCAPFMPVGGPRRLAQGQTGNVTSRPYFTEPAISPDRREIAFVSGGDIWAVPAAGGEARLLLSHPANESRPIYSPDGRKLAFVSNRTGGGDIYILTFATGDVTRLTFDDGNEQLDGWSRDGAWIYFSSTSRDIAGHERRVPRQRRRRHADGSGRRPLHERILLVAVARRIAASRSPRAPPRRASGGATAAVTSTKRKCGSSRDGHAAARTKR